MLVYLDSKDIINIIQNSIYISKDDFKNLLIKGEHKLVYSFTTIMEISEPLLHQNAKTNVMRLLNHLEEFPHTYIHSSSIPRLELKESLRAFTNNEEYQTINPFCQRFDYTVDVNASPVTKSYLNYPLSETIWDLYKCNAITGLNSNVKKYRELIIADRTLEKKPTIEKGFCKTIERQISLHKIQLSPSTNLPLANWIYLNPTRCPAERIGYEVWHKIVKNITDEPDDSDLEDFQHIECLPYVDLITLDRRMCGYVSQATATLGLDYSKKIYRSSKEIINLL